MTFDPGPDCPSHLHARMTLFRDFPIETSCPAVAAEREILQAWGRRAWEARKAARQFAAGAQRPLPGRFLLRPPPVTTRREAYVEEQLTNRRARRALSRLKRARYRFRDRAGPDVTRALEVLADVFADAEAEHDAARWRWICLTALEAGWTVGSA